MSAPKTRRRNPSTKAVRAELCDRIRMHGNKSLACREVGVDRSQFYRALEDKPEFAGAVARADREYLDRCAQEATRRAVMGVVRRLPYTEYAVTDDGLQVKVTKFREERVYSDRLLELILDRRHPDFKKREEVDLNVTGGVLQVEAPLSEGDWEKRFGELATKVPVTPATKH